MTSSPRRADDAELDPIHHCIPLRGGILLIAAALKLNGLAVDPVAGTGFFGSTAFQVAVVEFELLLAAWLFWGVLPVAAWVSTLVVFSGFTAVSGWQGWIGRASCGCFGQVTVSPWWAFLLDVTVLAGLLLGRPGGGRRKGLSLRPSLLPAVCGFLAVLTASLGLFGLFSWRYGSLDGAFAAIRGERISLYPRTADLGTGAPGEDCKATIEVVNRTDQTIRLIGGTTDCSCVVTGSLPLTIPPQDSRQIIVDVRLPKQAGLFTRKAGLVVDDGGLASVGFRITGRVQGTTEQ